MQVLPRKHILRISSNFEELTSEFRKYIELSTLLNNQIELLGSSDLIDPGHT